jgi:type II restriction enzyme
VNGKTSEDLILKQNVDVLIKPLSYATDALPIFMEAKSMSDEVNPNKRQKEEAQKINNLIRMWGSRSASDIIYLLLLGGTVPRRYLEVEAGSGIDWIWEHRVEDLKILLD